MFKLRYGVIISLILCLIVLAVSYWGTLPDGKLHLVFCDVGQGDGIYVRFPDGHDMVVDGGPNTNILGCLGRHMPFWDRDIDIVVLTHPQKDHLQGLISVFERYTVHHFMRSDVTNESDGFIKLMEASKSEGSAERLAQSGQRIGIGNVTLSVLWPTAAQIAFMRPVNTPGGNVLGVSAGNVNDASVVLKVSYGAFDALLTGDADSRVDTSLSAVIPPESDGLEVLKVPHHGASTGMNDAFFEKISRVSKNAVAVISVGKNTFGHPSLEIIKRLEKIGYTIVRTDEHGDIEVVSDGKTWNVVTQK